MSDWETTCYDKFHTFISPTCRVFVHDLQYFEAGHLPRSQQGPPLCLVEIWRHTDHRVIDWLLSKLRGKVLGMLQNHGQQLFRSVILLPTRRKDNLPKWLVWKPRPKYCFACTLLSRNTIKLLLLKKSTLHKFFFKKQYINSIFMKINMLFVCKNHRQKMCGFNTIKILDKYYWKGTFSHKNLLAVLEKYTLCLWIFF